MACVIQAGTYALAQDLAFELGEHREQAGHGAACGCGEIEGFGQRDETDSEVLQLLERRNQIRHGTALAVQAPHQHDIDFTSSCGSDQDIAPLALRRAGADFFDLRDDSPVALGRELAHGANLQRQCLLIVGGNASVQANPKGVAKTLWVGAWGKTCFGGISGV